MADTQTTVKTEPRQSTGVDPHQGVEVFDTNGAASTHQPNPTRDSTVVNDAGFGHADLHNAEMLRGDADTTAFRSTDLRNSELNTADFNNATSSDLSANGQGTNWSTILMVIALILLIILVGSWLF